MRLAVLRRGVLLASVVCISFALHAQQAELWKQGSWALQAPPPGNCGSLPLLQVKGPGSIFDPPHAAVLAALEKALPEALAKACPGTREVVLVSGRSRRLMRVAQVAAPAPTPTPTPATPEPAPPPQPVRETPAPTPTPAPAPEPAAPPEPTPAPQPTPVTRRREAPTPSNQLAPLQSAEVVSGGPPAPVLAARSDLRSLSSARNNEDKCEVLLAWLESGKSGDAAPTAYRMPMRANMQNIFRDEPMNAVFGMPYDKTENRWRLELHEKVFMPCLGYNSPRNTPFAPRRPNATMQQYGQQFQQDRQLIDGAFLGQPGQFEPTAITRYVQQVRTQAAWANQAMASAAAAPANRQSFDQLTAQRQSAPGQMSLLTAADKSQVTDFLSRRLSNIASPIAEEWFRGASGTSKGAASAKVLNTQYASLGPVLSAMDASTRSAFQSKYNQLVESLVTDSLQADLAKLRAIPPTLPGVIEIAGWKATFDAGYRDLRALPAIQAADHEYQQNRARVFTGALPSWIQQVESIPVDGAAITSKRHDMEILFPAREDRASPVYTQYEAPIRAKEDQLRLRVEAELRKQQEEAAAAERRQQAAQAAADAAAQAAGGKPAAPPPTPRNQLARGTPGAALTAANFSAAGLNNEGFFSSIFAGDFDKIGVNSDDMRFADTFRQYLNSFGRQCARYLPQDTKVELTEQICTARWVNGYGADRGCANWETRGTGIYADPELHAINRKLELQAAMDVGRNALKMLTQKDPIGGMMNMVGDAAATNADMTTVVAKNGCASPGLKRFEQNLALYALNKQPIRLGESGPKLSPIDPLPGMPFRDQNYSKLMEDLIGDQSRSWVMNRYHSGSVTGVSVSSRDAKGRPAKIVANYTFDGFSGRSQGSATLTFGDGQPECIYFYDFPATCRTPNRRIVSSYVSGGYQVQ